MPGDPATIRAHDASWSSWSAASLMIGRTRHLDFGWLNWPFALAYVFLFSKAYNYLRDHHGSDNGSWLEGFGALYVAPVVAPFMPFIWLNWWVERRREAAQIRSGGGPLSDMQRRDQRSLFVGAALLLGVAALVVYLLLNSSP